jgi:hypothetical protein
VVGARLPPLLLLLLLLMLLLLLLLLWVRVRVLCWRICRSV